MEAAFSSMDAAGDTLNAGDLEIRPAEFTALVTGSRCRSQCASCSADRTAGARAGSCRGGVPEVWGEPTASPTARSSYIGKLPRSSRGLAGGGSSTHVGFGYASLPFHKTGTGR